MTLLELVRDASRQTFESEDGDAYTIELRAGLSNEEIAALEARLPCLIPADVRELLTHCSGFEHGVVDFVDFTGGDRWFDYETFRLGLPITADGFGNYWVVDLRPESTAWGPIYYASHDPPVILYQSPSLEHFLVELFKFSRPPFKSLIDNVHEDQLFHVWRTNPGVVQQELCLFSSDCELRAFAETLDSTYQIIDMRNAQIGFGFSWGRYGPKTAVRRHGNSPIFAYQRRTSIWKRFFGGSE
jgi:hypothetical protein